MVTTSFPLGAGQTLQRTITLANVAFRLPNIEVVANLRCDAAGARSEAAIALWEEVQKALTAQVITSAIGIPLHFRRFVRELDFDGRTLREWVNASQISRDTPFRTLAPAELAWRGFAFTVGDTAVFAAPDAALLLSPEFISTHCFFAREERGLAGLRFVPLTGRRIPDVSGTLWIDRETAELRSLEFSYNGLPAAIRRTELGGRMDFTRTPAGRWIVSHWYVRMPRMHSLRTTLRPSLAGYTDNGGNAVVASDTSQMRPLAVLTGRVHDSTAGRGLGGVIALLQDGSHRAVTDSAGRFQMFFPFGGPVRLAVFHPKLGLLGDPTTHEVVVSLGDTTFSEFAVPPLAAFERAVCSGAPRAGRAHVIGSARMADGSPAFGRDVAVSTRVNSADVPMHGVRSARVTRSGAYGICNLPGLDTVHITLRRGRGGEILADSLVILPGKTRWLDLRP